MSSSGLSDSFEYLCYAGSIAITVRRCTLDVDPRAVRVRYLRVITTRRYLLSCAVSGRLGFPLDYITLQSYAPVYTNTK